MQHSEMHGTLSVKTILQMWPSHVCSSNLKVYDTSSKVFITLQKHERTKQINAVGLLKKKT